MNVRYNGCARRRLRVPGTDRNPKEVPMPSGYPGSSGGNRLTPAERFWAKVDKTETCWLWTAGLDPRGYGTFTRATKRTGSAHQWAYEHLVGSVPDGLELDHLCRVRRCVNPAHLEPVTHAENMRRAAKDHCKNGHPLAGDNLFVRSDRARVCRACWHENSRRYKERKAARVSS